MVGLVDQPPALVYCCSSKKWLIGVKAILKRKKDRNIEINASDDHVRFPCPDSFFVVERLVMLRVIQLSSWLRVVAVQILLKH
jgi:hypothetical protein